ncbi:hypothetical protein BC332_10915 [Capsicum chinense]|nr:hypothetical protein BC332_10915 [Capsicum chinense]
MDMEDKPEHLPVLVHGILASPSDWTFLEQEGINCWAATNQFDHLGNTTSRCQREKTASISIRTSILEKLAAPIATFLAGHTGSQLFLTDGKPNKPPLLLRMASDFDDDELFKPPRRSLDGYKHVVDMEYCPGVPSEGPHFPPKAAKAKEAAQNAPCMQTTLEYHEIMEEEMMRGLQQFSWKKVDASFHSAFWPFFANNNIHVKSEWFHNAGAGVIAHVADNIKQQEKQQEHPLFITATL